MLSIQKQDPTYRHREQKVLCHDCMKARCAIFVHVANFNVDCLETGTAGN